MSVAKQASRVKAVKVPNKTTDSISDCTNRMNPADRAIVEKSIARPTTGKVFNDAFLLFRNLLALSL